MGSESGTRVLTAGQGSLLALVFLVLASVLVFQETAFSSSPFHTPPEPAVTIALEADPITDALCHHRSDHGGSVIGTADTGVSGPVHDGKHHDVLGCCFIAVCGASCAGVCSGVGVSTALSSAIPPSEYGVSGRAFLTVEDTVLPGMLEAPFRPPIAELASSPS